MLQTEIAELMAVRSPSSSLSEVWACIADVSPCAQFAAKQGGGSTVSPRLDFSCLVYAASPSRRRPSSLSISA